MANAARLFYTPFLPDSLQDGEAWAKLHDLKGCLAHEAMRQYAIGSGVSPFATGDAIAGGWGATNYALYGSSHVGILGSIIDTTDVSGILKLDLRKTDFFQENAYPSYLFYNPYDEVKTVTFDAGAEIVDFYDAVTNTVIMQNVSGQTGIALPADAALLLVLIPAGGTVTYVEEKMLVNGIIADYRSGQPVGNHQPRIKALAADSTIILFGQTLKIYCTATDRDSDELNYDWTINSQAVTCDSAVLVWTAPAVEDIFNIVCRVSDGIAPAVMDSLQITVIAAINHEPIINSLLATARRIDKGDTTRITCSASDPDGDILEFSWTATFGELIGSDSVVSWVAPDTVGYYYVKCHVSDNRGGFANDSIGIMVRDSGIVASDPVAWYPFSGNADDQSGFGNHGNVNGATLTANRFGNPNSAYYFNGASNHIRVPNSASLNFTDAITVSFWMKAAELYSTRESYPISHGNWENRWKVSIIPDKRIRWTVKSSDGIKDLDSQTKATVNIWYHVVGLYDGSDFNIYINGTLEGHTTFSGKILTTTIDLMIGQVLPNNSTYNFKGTIDDIRLYDYALTANEIQALYGETSAIHTDIDVRPLKFALSQNFPNPFNPVTSITYDLPQAVAVKLQVFDLSGRLVQTLVDEKKPAGHYSAIWSAQNVSSGIYFFRLSAGDFSAVKKCVKLK